MVNRTQRSSRDPVGVGRQCGEAKWDETESITSTTAWDRMRRRDTRFGCSMSTVCNEMSLSRVVNCQAALARSGGLNRGRCMGSKRWASDDLRGADARAADARFNEFTCVW
jgi:hypothetical protein